MSPRPHVLAALAALVLAAGCAAGPVGVRRVDPREVHRNLTASVLTLGEPSLHSRNVLERLGLGATFDSDPVAALSDLRELALAGEEGDVDFALAELSFLHAERHGERAWHLAAALYAWSFLFGGEPPDPFDPRLRIAADLYNRALTEGFASADDASVELRAGTFPLPFGTLDVGFDPAALEWSGRHLRRFIPVAELEVRGLRSRFRTSGIGAPLAADAAADDPEASTDFLAPRLMVPATAVLVVEDVRRQLATGRVRARLDLDANPDPKPLEIAGRQVPLEREQTATIAAMLADSPVWERERQAFLGGLATQMPDGLLVALRPHRRGRTPVVFVHGTRSSPGRWAEMANVLDNRPRIRRRFEPWFFFYGSGDPILYSSYLLRKNLRGAVERIDPSGQDPCLREIVIAGHSQGGLLAKMTAVESADRFWRSVSREPLENVRLSEADRIFARDVMFVEPLPFVKRVVFIATPHRGSFLAARRTLRHWLSALVSVPRRVTDFATTALAMNPGAFRVHHVEHVTALDNMAPGNRLLRVLADLPIAPGVTAHSIIAVEDDGPFELGDDGVVAYASAHLDDVASETVVRSSHSVQSHPQTIEELHRILLEHEAASSCAAEMQADADGSG